MYFFNKTMTQFLIGAFIGFCTLFSGEFLGQQTVQRGQVVQIDPDLDKSAGFSSDAGEYISINEMKALLGEKFASYDTYQASIKELIQGKLRQGKIFIKKPHQVRLTYFVEDRVKMDVVSGEKTLFIHIPEYDIVYEQDLIDTESEELYSIKSSSLEFLFENYNFNFFETESLVPVLDKKSANFFNVITPPDPNTYALELSAKDITRGLDSMQIWVEPNGLIVRSRTESIDKAVVDIYFYDIQLDEPISDGTFEFVLGPSVKILKNYLK